MTALTIRISNMSRDILRELATKEGASMQTILDRAIESYRRQRFLEEVNNAYAALRQDSKAWLQVEKERTAWDTTLGDGLESNERPSESRKTNSTRRRKRHG